MQTQCKKCVMDKSAEEITFDSDGVCNFCHQAQEALKQIEAEKHKLPDIVEKIKKDGFSKKYDVLIGLSGGVDSSYTLLRALQLGLRPLCYSVDNGWNDPRADENIMNLVENLKVPFFRYTIDLKQFSKLQGAFIQAGVPNIEIPTDHILMATTYEMASIYGIKWILSGGNVATESIMPASWGYNARDLVHIKDIYKKMTGEKLKGLPVCSLLKWNYYKWIKRIKIFYLLDYVDYNKEKAIEELSKYGWKDYEEKHGENVFTKWHMNYYLFEKFGFDKRKPHYSSLINSGQLDRKEALRALGNNPVFPNIGLEERVFKYPKRSHDEFKKDKYDLIAKIIRLCK